MQRLIYRQQVRQVVAGCVLEVVDRLDPAGNAAGGYLIAVAAIEAGVGDRVLVVDEGTGARQILGNSKAPIRSVVVGVVDSVDIN